MLLFGMALANMPVEAGTTKRIVPATNRTHNGVRAVMWRHPDNIASRDLVYGVGGKANQPRGRFTFVEEDLGGTNPKFLVEDSQGQRWKVKLGTEARSETTATRLLWAVGYLVDQDYFSPEITVRGLKKLNRGQKFVLKGGTVRGARLERQLKRSQKIGNWSWNRNPFVGTRELNGLAVMMSLISNWDLKKSNNDVYRIGDEYHYVVSDVGATFGDSDLWRRRKADLKAYQKAKFVRKTDLEEVDLRLPVRPPSLHVFAFPRYIQRTRLASIASDLPRHDVEWIGRLLSQLSARQIADAFRAGGFSVHEVEGYSEAVRNRIAQVIQQ